MALGLRELLASVGRERPPVGSSGYQEPQIVAQTAYGPAEDEEVSPELLEALLAQQRPTVRDLVTGPYMAQLASPTPRPAPTNFSLAGISGVNLGGVGRGRGGGGGGAAIGGGGVSGFTPGAGSNAETAREIARWIESRPGDFQVGGLEGFQGTGQISTGHVTNSQHYTGEAGDVNYYGGGRWKGEPAALDWLYNRLQQRYGPDLTELLWRVADHYNHLHYGTRRGG